MTTFLEYTEYLELKEKEQHNYCEYESYIQGWEEELSMYLERENNPDQWMSKNISILFSDLENCVDFARKIDFNELNRAKKMLDLYKTIFTLVFDFNLQVKLDRNLLSKDFIQEVKGKMKDYGIFFCRDLFIPKEISLSTWELRQVLSVIRHDMSESALFEIEWIKIESGALYFDIDRLDYHVYELQSCLLNIQELDFFEEVLSLGLVDLYQDYLDLEYSTRYSGPLSDKQRWRKAEERLMLIKKLTQCQNRELFRSLEAKPYLEDLQAAGREAAYIRSKINTLDELIKQRKIK